MSTLGEGGVREDDLHDRTWGIEGEGVVIGHETTRMRSLSACHRMERTEAVCLSACLPVCLSATRHAGGEKGTSTGTSSEHEH